MKIIIISLILFFSINGYTEGLRIAILDFAAGGVPDTTAKIFSDWLRTELINNKKLIIIERSAMTSIMKEQAFSMSGCTDTACAVEIGKILSANKMLIGSIQMWENKIVINARLVDVEKGIAEIAHRASYNSVKDLDREVVNFAQDLSSRIEGIPVVMRDADERNDSGKIDAALSDDTKPKTHDIVLDFETDGDINSIIYVVKNYVIDGDICFKKKNFSCARDEYIKGLTIIDKILTSDQKNKIGIFIKGIQTRIEKTGL